MSKSKKAQGAIAVRKSGRRARHHRAAAVPATARVLCDACGEFFLATAAERECSNGDTCLSCLRAESEETLAVLRRRGITLPPLGGVWK